MRVRFNFANRSDDARSDRLKETGDLGPRASKIQHDGMARWGCFSMGAIGAAQWDGLALNSRGLAAVVALAVTSG